LANLALFILFRRPRVNIYFIHGPIPLGFLKEMLDENAVAAKPVDLRF